MKMMVKFGLFSFCLVTMNAPAVAGQLYDTYLTIRNDLYQMQYAEVLKVVAELDLSPKEKREIQSHPIKFGHQFPFLSSIPSSLVTELSYFEAYSEDGGVGCLSVNGFGDVYQPVTVSLQFLMKEQVWKVKHVKIDHLPDYDRFYKQADCSI
ncbi:hypothetical protein VrSk94_22690 [Vibrio rotiferianus]